MEVKKYLTHSFFPSNKNNEKEFLSLDNLYTRKTISNII